MTDLLPTRTVEDVTITEQIACIERIGVHLHHRGCLRRHRGFTAAPEPNDRNNE